METKCDTHLRETHMLYEYTVSIWTYFCSQESGFESVRGMGLCVCVCVCVCVRNLDTRGSVNLMLQDPLSSDYWRGKVTRAPCDKNDKRSPTAHSLCEVQQNGIYAKFHENSSGDFTGHCRLETHGRMNWETGIIPWEYLLYGKRKEHERTVSGKVLETA